MFRDSGRSGIDAKRFGVGSLISDQWSHCHVVVATAENMVQLVDCENWTVKGKQVAVSDVDHLTEKEVRALCDQTGLDWTFTDFDFTSDHSKGLKGFDMNSVSMLKSLEGKRK